MELDLNIDSNGNVIVNTLSEYVAYISQLQAANEGSNERFFFRGQSNKNWDVRPCLFRALIPQHYYKIFFLST